MSFNLKKYSNKTQAVETTEKQLQESRVSKEQTSVQEVQLKDNRAKIPSELTEKQLDKTDSVSKEVTEKQLDPERKSKDIIDIKEVELEKCRTESPSQLTEKQLESSELRKSASKENTSNEVKLDEYRAESPSQLTEKQLDTPRKDSSKDVVLVEGQLNSSKDGLVKHRNEEAHNGNINKLEEKRLAGEKKEIQEKQKAEMASENNDLKWDDKKDDYGLRLAQKIENSLEGISDFMASPIGQGTTTDPLADSFDLPEDSFQNENPESEEDDISEKDRIILDKMSPKTENVGGTPVLSGSVQFKLKGFLDEHGNLVKEDLEKSIKDYLSSKHSIKAPVLGTININVQDQSGTIGYIASVQ